jgi:predicted ATPase
MNENQLIVSNFRSWKGDNFIDLPNINLLLGSNSCGKSSIIHALSLLKQSELSRRLIPNDSEIDLGRIEDQVNFHTKAKSRRDSSDYIGFGFRYQIQPYDIVQLALHNRRIRREVRRMPLGNSVNDQANILTAELGNLEYIERFDDLGAIKEITLSSRRQQLLRVIITKLSYKKLQLTLEVTNDPKFWNLFVDLSNKEAAIDPFEQKNINDKLKDMRNEEKAYEREWKDLNLKIRKLRETDLPAERSQFSELMSERRIITQKMRIVEEEIDGLMDASGSKIIPGATHKNKCSYLADALSYTIETSFEALEEDNVVDQLTSIFLYDTRRLSQYGTPKRLQKTSKHDDAAKAANAIELIHANSSSIVTTPFHLLKLAKTQYEKCVSSIVRIGPHRERPDRITLVNPNDKSTFVGTKGENVMSIINQSSPTQMKELNKWLALLEIPYIVDKKFNKAFNISQLILKDTDDMLVSLADVGYGIGQVLPVILTSMLQENTIITIEQPELHLHPKLQANLADLFIRSAEKNNNTFILETHSEHIILRLKRRQREQVEVIDKGIKNIPSELKRSTVTDRRFSRSTFFGLTFSSILPIWKSIRNSVVLSVVEIQNQERKSQLTRVTLNSDGEFDNTWPGDFFPERYNELGLEDEY